MSTAIFADAISELHDTGPGHPEQPARFEAAVRGLDGTPPTACAPREATMDELALCHDRRYIESARRDVEAGRSELSTGDTQISARSFEVAARAAGTVLTAVDCVMGGQAQNGLCVVRPPGHHATPTRGMGFCLLNNVAIGARYAQRKYGVDRVLIADWDVHHGNGTQDIFYGDGSVFFFSSHQSPWYPGTGAANETGEGEGAGTTLNCPLAAGAGMGEIGDAFLGRLAPAMAEFRPELVMISAGFDSRVGDPLGRFRLTDADFAELTRQLMEIADRYAGGRVVSVLEGGYDLRGLECAVRAHAGALKGVTYSASSPGTRRA